MRKTRVIEHGRSYHLIIRLAHRAGHSFWMTGIRRGYAFMYGNVIMGERYHTDIDDILSAVRCAGARGERLSIVSHAIGRDAGRINMKTEWLERMLAVARDAGVVVRGLR